MTILKCVNAKKSLKDFGPIQFPYIGTVEFDKDNQIEVADELVEKFLAVKTDHEFHIINEDGIDETAKIIEEEKKNDPKAAEKVEYEKELNSLNINEINALISEYPEAAGLKRKTEKVTFLVNKYKPTA